MNCNFKDNVETLEMLKFGYARVGKDWQGEAIDGSTKKVSFIQLSSIKNAAKIFARKGMDEALRNSFGVCCLPPLAPIPQMEVTPAI